MNFGFASRWPNMFTTDMHLTKMFCLLISFTIVFVTPSNQLTSPTASSRTNQILSDREQLRFSPWENNGTFISTTSYNAMGMGPLYKTTNKILDIIIGPEPIPDGFIIVDHTQPNIIQLGPRAENREWDGLLKHYWPLVTIVILAVVLILVMPIVTFCFYCCRCFGACGGRSAQYDKKHDTCRRFMLGSFLILGATGLIFGVVISFVTNSYMYSGVENSTVTARHGVTDVKEYLHSTSNQANFILVKNFKELSVRLEALLHETANVVIDKLEDKSQTISLEELDKFVKLLPNVIKDLSRMKEITNGLRVNASQLSDGLRGVKRELLVSLTKCSTDECHDVLVKYEIGKLDINGIDYNQLPDVSTTIDSVNDLINDDIIDRVSNGQDKLNQLRFDLNASIYRSIPLVLNAIDSAGSALSAGSNNITKLLNGFSDTISDSSKNYLNIADDYLNEYGFYVYYTGIAVSSVLLLVLTLIVFGLLCGCCGKRPYGYGDDCCNKGAGARFLMLGVCTIFFTISLLAAYALVFFLAGLLMYRGVCVPLNDPANDPLVIKYYDYLIDLNTVLYPNLNSAKYDAIRHGLLHRSTAKDHFKISELITSCHRNESIYKVLRLDNILDINDIKNISTRYGIDDQLSKLLENIELNTNIEILSPEAAESIRKLGDSELRTFDSYKFVDNLNASLTNKNLTELIQILIDTANRIPAGLEMNEIRISLKNQALHLKSYQDNLVQPMTDQTNEMMSMSLTLERNLPFNKLSPDEIEKFIESMRDAEQFINSDGLTFVRITAAELMRGFSDDIDIYVNYVVSEIVNEFGRCGPMSNVYKSSVVGLCNRVVDPFNGFWTGVGWCVLLFLPIIIISVKLSSLYQKSEPYPGPNIESELLYDAYSERDNIPLSSNHKNKKRKKNGRRRSSRDRRGDYFEDSASPQHCSSSGGPRDTRYTDMAPKHWDGGPPRYQNPPIAPPASEFDRPPPYYYPEPSDAE